MYSQSQGYMAAKLIPNCVESGVKKDDKIGE
jgi:hypothetical protein